MKLRQKPLAPKKTGTAVAGPHKYQATHSTLDPLFEGDIDYLIRTIRIREVRAIEVLLSPLNLQVSAWYPLAVLRVLDGMSQRELGNRLDLKDAAIGKAIDAMEKVGLVQRMADQNDRRKALVYLTDAGKTLAKKVATRRQQFLKALVEGFSQEEVSQFSKLLERCYANIDKFVEKQSK
jgi:DNA-binding MarR family transcriptional regulator